MEDSRRRVSGTESLYENSNYMLEGAIEQPATFAYSSDPGDGSGESVLAVTKSSAASVLESYQPKRFLMPTQVAVVVKDADKRVEAEEQIRNEDEFRAWLTHNYFDYFQPYSSVGGMPNRIFLDFFADRDLFRNRKLADLMDTIDKDKDGRVSWQEFFDYMTYRKRSEVSRARRALNSMVRSAAPAASKQERKVRREAETDGEPVPDEAYLEFYDCRPPPIFIPTVLVIVWIFFLVYLVELNKGPAWNHVTWMGGIPYYSPLVFCPARRQEVWRFVSYLLLHAGWHHIFFNTFMTALLGIPLELVHKAWRVAPIFLCGVLAGSLLSSVAEPAVTLMGASGGVYALIGAHYGLVLMNWEELQDGWLRCRRGPLSFLSSGVFRLLALTMLVSLDFGVALYRRYSDPNVRDSASLTAHVAGLVCGLLVGIPALRNIDVKPWEKVVLKISVIFCFLFLVFAILWNIFYKGYPVNIPCNTAVTA